MPQLPRAPVVLSFALVLSLSAAAQSVQDQTGLTALIQRVGAGNQPTGANVLVGQVEAGGTAYAPDSTNPEFAGKTFTLKSPGGAVSGHATVVGQYMYGLSSSLSPAVTSIECHDASHFLAGGFLNGTGGTAPDIATFKILNNSWIGSGIDPKASLRKLDFAATNQDFVICCGVNNGAGPLDQPLLSHGFNSISCGRSDGQHRAGNTGLGMDRPGRMKPELVAPAGATSFSTPLVSGAATLLVDTARNDPTLAGNLDAERADLIKAALMAGAEHRAGWTNNAASSGPTRGSTATPLDALYGADEIDVNHSHWILTGGEQASATTSAAALATPHAGWEEVDIGASESRFWRFEVPALVPHASIVAAWNRVVAANFLSFQCPNLDLELWSVDGAGNLTTLVGDPGLPKYAAGNVQSLSTVDNVEHLYIDDLQPGSYALELRRTTDTFASWRVAVAWELFCPEPIAYGTGKTMSTGGVPQLSTRGIPSATRDTFELDVANALPGKDGLAFWGVGQASKPFHGGTLLVQGPLHRLPLVTLDANGAIAIPIAIDPSMAGTTRDYQFWFRDPLHPDGTGIGLTNAVEIEFCY